VFRAVLFTRFPYLLVLAIQLNFARLCLGVINYPEPSVLSDVYDLEASRKFT
jgi:hypothetical protein